ncbi:MAG: hypothetical protein D6705_14925, partial [Deltaproteobacteria bacterium]
MNVAGNVFSPGVWAVGLAVGAAAAVGSGACVYKNTQHCQFGGTVCGPDEYCDICRDDWKGCFPISDDPDPSCVFDPSGGSGTGGSGTSVGTTMGTSVGTTTGSTSGTTTGTSVGTT